MEGIAAGIGVEVITVDGAPKVDIMVVGTPSGEVWSRRWSPGGISPWRRHGRPVDERIRGVIGTQPDPTNPGASLIGVTGNDRQIWFTSSAGGPWIRWAPAPPITTITGGKAKLMMDSVPCAIAVDTPGELYVVENHP